MSVELTNYGFWFGQPWPSDDMRAPACEDDEMRVPAPVGELCIFCDEAVLFTDRGILMPCLDAKGMSTIQAAHIECQFANVVGGAAHIGGGKCEHCGGTGDPYAGLSYRESALEVWKAWNGPLTTG